MVDLELAVTLDPTNPAVLLATITAQAERLRSYAPAGPVLEVFAASNGVRIRSDGSPDWFSLHESAAGRRTLYLRGTKRDLDAKVVRIPLTEWPKLVDALWEASDAKVFTWQVTVPDYGTERGMGADPFGHERRAAKATQDVAAVAPVSRTCENDLVRPGNVCGRRARFRMHGPRRTWLCCEVCCKPTWVIDGSAVLLDGAPVAPVAPVVHVPKPVDRVAALRAKLDTLVSVPLARVREVYGLFADADCTDASKLRTYEDAWSRRLYAMVSPVGIPAGPVTLRWTHEAALGAYRPEWTWCGLDAEGKPLTYFHRFANMVSARDLPRLIESLTANPLCGA